MPHLILRLFGGFHAETSDGTPLHLPTDKIRGLLAYLALEADQPQRREHLAALLWPEWDDVASLRNLRQSLYRLRNSLEKAAPALFDALCTVTRQDVTLHSSALRSDMADFWQGMALPARHQHRSLSECQTCRAAVADAVELYRGELLAGLSFADAPEFEAWLVGQRQRYHLAFLSALSQLADVCLAEGDFPQAYTYAERQLALEPWREIAHRQVMQALAASGQRSAAIEHFHRCRTILAEELGVDPEPETAALFQELLEPTAPRPTQSVAATPSQVARTAATNLPVALSSFVGREDAMEHLRLLLQQHRLLTLIGPGGSGKTRLATETGRGLLATFPGGVWLVELAELSDPERVVHAIADCLGVTEQESHPLRQLLADFLSTRRPLLILDNCEHLLAACATVTEFLLTRCPGVQVLATSREALGIVGEQLWPVPPLPLPAAASVLGTSSDLHALLSAPAIRLFVDRAVSHRPSFVLTLENAADVVRICCRLDGMPLALELAAARVRALTPARIAQLLDERFSLLTGGSRTALPRQQTLRALMDWSYDLLSPAEQTLFRRLAVFAGSASMEAVEAICADGSGDGQPRIGGTSVFDLLLRLVDKSMLLVEDDGKESRYWMLETIHSYAQERLGETEEAEEMARGHARYLIRLAASAEEELVGGDEVTWLERLGKEDDNLHAALQWAFGGPAESRSAHARLGLRLAGYLVYYWDARFRLDDSRRWLNMAWENVDRRIPAIEQARLASGLGTLAWHGGQYNEARNWHQQAVRLYQQAEDSRGIALSLNNLAIQYDYTGDWAGGEKLMKEAIRVAELGGHPGIQALTLSSLGAHYCSLERYDAAGPLLERATALLRARGSARLFGYVLTALLEYQLATGRRHLGWATIAEMDVAASRCGDLSLRRAFFVCQAQMLRFENRMQEAFVASATGVRFYRDTLPDVDFLTILESFVISLVELGRSDVGLLLLTFCETYRDAGQDSRAPIYQTEVDAALARIRAHLPPDEFAALQGQGASLTLESALALALRLADEPETRF